jgi:hypothetical protein
MCSPDVDPEQTRLIRQIYLACACYLADHGDDPELSAVKAARRVVWELNRSVDLAERSSTPPVGRVFASIKLLEAIVGRPVSEDDI